MYFLPVVALTVVSIDDPCEFGVYCVAAGCRDLDCFRRLARAIGVQNCVVYLTEGDGVGL